MFSGDTSPEAAAVLRARLLAMTPGRRLEQGAALCRLSRQVMRAGIRKRHPDYDDARVEMALARLLWGDELYRAARPRSPMVDP